MPRSLEFEKLLGSLHCEDDDSEEEEEEALSLSDLPTITIPRDDIKDEGKEEENESQVGEDFDFDFGSLIGSISPLESGMCTADEVFSGGQLLPFRHSVSSEAGLLSGSRIPSRSVSRSESMDRTGFESRSTSTNSRSSSTRSHLSTTSSSSSSSSGGSANVTYGITRAKQLVPKPKVRNQFHSHPSPNPRIRPSGVRPAATATQPTSTKSTMWQVLRMGLVRTPEIELQDLKGRRHRTSNYNKNPTITRSDSNKSTTSSNNNNDNNNKSDNDSPRMSFKISDLLAEIQKRNNNNNNNQSNGGGGGIFKSCRCSVGAIEPINFSPKTSIRCSNSSNYNNKSSSSTTTKQVLSEDKDLVLQKKKQEQQQKEQQRHKQFRQGKHVVSHHRTFEWLRDLSHASVLNS